MERDTSTSAPDEQRYVIDEAVQHGYVGDRDARTFLPFLLPHLRPGMDIVDAGCGVGSIALDLAPTIAPGRVVGIDRDPAQVDAARKSAVERGISNAQFHAASVYELPFPDASFDAVYANAVAQADRRHALPQRQDRGQHAHTATFVPRPR